MRLRSLSLERFRNHAATRVDINDADIVAFVGENGSGKTTLLEAVSILSLSKSCRGAEDDDVVQWNEGSYRVRAGIRADDGTERTVEIVCERHPRRRKAGFINDVRVPAARIVGELPTVTFLPEDLDLFRGPPAGRRGLLDRLLCQVSSEYLQDLSRYQRLLKQRNALLKQLANGVKGDLSTWDVPLAAAGASLTVARLELMETFAVTLGSECASLGLPWDDVRFAYERTGTARDVHALEKQMIALLAQHRPRDLQMLATSVGPHRDDWTLQAGGRDIAVFASRGQERLALLALLSLEVSFLELRKGEKPVILLDDAFSELDEHHGALLLPALHGAQVLVTSARALPRIKGMQTWEIANGGVLAAKTR